MSISRTSRNWLTLFEPNLQSGLNPISSYADYAQSFKTLYIDDHKDYGEDRWTGVGMMSNGIVIVLVFTERERKTIRLISLRKATKNERARYEKAIENRLGKN